MTSWYESLAGTRLLISARRNSERCAKPPHCCAVGLVSLLCKKCCQTFVEDSGCLAHSTTCCENQWSEGGPLDFSDMLFIGAALLFLMSTVVSCQLVRPVRWSAWVEDPYVQKCPFEPASPETSCTDVQSGFLSTNACSDSSGHTTKFLFCRHSH